MKFIVLLVLPVFLFSCSPNQENGTTPEEKAQTTYKPTGKMPEPVDERTSMDAPVPDAKMAKDYGVSLEQIGLGHAVYLRKCGECHLHVLPDQMEKENWHVVVPGMSWNAGLTAEEEQALQQYLKVASQVAKKP
ncbi:MAG: hypothetical protein ACON38_01065 [Akkermansiaceae bacterium]